MSPFQKLAKWWTCKTCLHYWRPAKTSKGPARYCPLCDTIEPLTPEMFFAYFGRWF